VLEVDKFARNKSWALPTEIGADGHGPLLITRGIPTSNLGQRCYQVATSEHRLYH
jgi:hypothetical protein